MITVEEAGTWSRRRRCGVIILIFVWQLIFIFWLGRRIPIQPAPGGTEPTVRLAGPQAGTILALTDPTLFALPHRHGFSGPAWLNFESPTNQPFIWSETSIGLDLPRASIAAFDQFMMTNQFKPLGIAGRLETELLLPELPDEPMFRPQSGLLVSGSLAGRRLLTAVNLPAWTNDVLLSNTVIQVVVDALGTPMPVAAVRDASCGLAAADQFALDWVRKARFDPIPGATRDTWAHHPQAELSFGEILFQWHTIPKPSENGSSTKP